MTRDEETFQKLGREIVRMIRDVQSATKGETGYARRKFTFPGGAVDLFVVNDAKLADRFEATAAEKYDVQSITPPSQLN